MIQKTILFLFLISTLLLVSCKRHQLKKSEVFATNTTKPAVDSVRINENTENNPVSPPLAPIKKVNVDVRNTDFESLKIRTKVNFNSDKISQNFPATIQIRKDSIIWISVSVGLEAARGIIRQDSIFFMDRLNKNYYQFDFETLSRQFGFKLDYPRIQSLLIGNLFSPQNEETRVEETGGFYFLKQKENSLLIESAIDQLSKKLTNVIAYVEVSGEKMTINYNDLTSFGSNSMPLKIEVSIDNLVSNSNTAKVSIELQKVEFLTRNLSFPFSIPKSYTEKSITTP
jgi:hypothetical protein